MNGKATGSLVRAAVCGVLLVVLAATASFSAFAWFSKNRAVRENNMELGLDVDNAVAEYKVYKYDLALNNGVGAGTTLVIDQKTKKPVTVDGEAKVITIEDLDLNQYDTIFTKRNRYTPAFIQIKLTRAGATPPADGSINVTLTRGADVKYFAGDDNGNFVLDTDGKKTEVEEETTNAIAVDCSSQVLRFSAMLDKISSGKTNSEVGSDEMKTYAEQTDDDMYSYVDGKLYETVSGLTCTTENANNTDTSKTFYTSVEANTDTTAGAAKYLYEKEDSITLSLDYVESDWAPAKDDEGGDVQVIYLYVYISYDVGLVECYKEEHNLTVLSVGRDYVDFENNLEKISISFGK